MFQGLTEQELNEVEKFRHFYQFHKNDSLPTQKEKKHGFYCIQLGHVRECLPRDSRDKILRICGPGDLVGFGSTQYAVEALEPVSACFFPFQDFQVLQKKIPGITTNLVEMLCKIIQIKDRRISSLENHSVKNRVASVLVSLASKFGEPSKLGTHIAAYVDRHTMAKLAGTSPETLARVITDLQEDGLISREKRAIHIVNLPQLNKLAIE